MHFCFQSSVFLEVAVSELQKEGQRKQTYSNHLRAANIGLILRSFVTGLFSATVTEVTAKLICQQPIDKVGAAVPYISEVKIDATISAFRLSNADFLFNTTLSHCRMIIIQPDREACTTFVNRWTCGHHFFPCISLETIPAIEHVVTFAITCCIGAIFSVCVGQIHVLWTYN